MLEKLLCMVIAALVLCSFGNPIANAQSSNELYQVSVINALLQGSYDGDVSIGELKQHGDFGIGTFDALDGEMVGLDGVFYQVKSSGQVMLAAESVKTPFASVLQFKPQLRNSLSDISDYAQLQKTLNAMITEPNYFYAIRIDGFFTYVKTRSVPAQTKPYRPLANITETQPVFELQQVKGTVVGFWCPQYVNGINVPGYHLHFISDDRTKGGHLLALGLQTGDVQVARVTSLQMILPDTDAFRKASLSQDYSKELKKVEQ